MFKGSKHFILGLILASAPLCPVRSADFSGKQIKVLIGFGPGGGYDQYGRLVAANIGRFLPGHPSVVPENVPGGGSVVVARKIYASSPKDGTEWGIVARDVITQPLTLPTVAGAFNATKFSWLGSADSETNVCFADVSAGIADINDLKSKTLQVGADGAGTGTFIYPTILNSLIGTKFKIVNGYNSSDEIFLALDRHEIEGGCDSYSSLVRKEARSLQSGQIKILFWAGYALPALKTFPNVMTFVSTETDRQILDFVYAGQIYARPFIAPPNLPADVYEALSTAFAQTLVDPTTLAEAAKQNLEVQFVGGKETREAVERAYRTPPALIADVKSRLATAH